jgi:hypothetical protein
VAGAPTGPDLRGGSGATPELAGRDDWAVVPGHPGAARRRAGPPGGPHPSRPGTRRGIALSEWQCAGAGTSAHHRWPAGVRD